jgi:hypothetical protein
MERNSDRVSTAKDAREFIEGIARINGSKTTQDSAERSNKLAGNCKEQQSNNVTSCNR